MLSLSADEAELLLHDPQEYIRVELDPFENAAHPRTSLTTFVQAMAATRPKETLKITDNLISSNLEAFAAAPADARYEIPSYVQRRTRLT
jgi:hypothetical protein